MRKTSFSNIGSRANSDEVYIIELCDEILGIKVLRLHRFEFLRGESGTPLPVDAYYPELNLVVEFHEWQHTEAVAIFDRKITISGVSRGAQRKIYDQRRAELLPLHGIKLVVISYTDFSTSKKLKREYNRDIDIVRAILKKGT